MTTDFRSTVGAGFHYSKVWPCRAELATLFPENNMIRLAQLLTNVMPATAAAIVYWQLQWYGSSTLVLATVWALLLLSLPLQTYYWLGHRARSPLPPQWLRWFLQIREEMQQAGVAVPAVKGRPLFADLAQTLNTAFGQLDRSFLKQMF